MRPVALIDLDGTLADFDSAMRSELAQLDEIAKPLGSEMYSGDAEEKHPHMAARRALVKAKPGFWSGLKELALGVDILAELRAVGFRVHIATRASKKYPQCWAEKIQWCVDTLGFEDVGITITTDKTLVHGDVLVDDWPGYFEPWLKAHPLGRVLVPAQPWNEGHGVEWGERVSAMDSLRLQTGASIIRVTEETPVEQLAEMLMKDCRRAL